MTTEAETTEGRLGRLEGRAEEQSQAINRLHDGVQLLTARVDQTNVRIDQLQSDMVAGFQQVNGRVDQLQSDMNAGFQQLNSRIDRLSYMIVGVGGGVIAALVGLIVTLVVQGNP